jgi:hypothetical protein
VSDPEDVLVLEITSSAHENIHDAVFAAAVTDDHNVAGMLENGADGRCAALVAADCGDIFRPVAQKIGVP